MVEASAVAHPVLRAVDAGAPSRYVRAAVTAAEALRRADELHRAGNPPVERIYAADCEIVGNPAAVRPPAHGASLEQQFEASDEQGVAWMLHEIIEDHGGRALFSGKWVHDAPGESGRGSAGLYFGVCTVADDLIVRLVLFATEDEARADLDDA